MLLEIKNLHFSYTKDKRLFENLNLRLEPGRTVALAGESGCGKSTLLNLIYGLTDWDQGEIWFKGKKLLGPKGNIVPGEKEMKMVAQNYDLMPYSTVHDNVGKFLSNINLKAKKEKVLELLDVVGLSEYADVKPQFLSGGQQQRVAIARSLSVVPNLLLLDEPFSNLDYSRKIELRSKLFSYVERHGISLIISTHEIEEVMPWLDRLVILQDGRLIQNDSPEETYRQPYNEYVARLLGEVNSLTPMQKSALHAPRDFCFPEQLELASSGIPALVLESRFAGSHYWNKLKLADAEIVLYHPTALSGQVKIQFKRSL